MPRFLLSVFFAAMIIGAAYLTIALKHPLLLGVLAALWVASFRWLFRLSMDHLAVVIAVSGITYGVFAKMATPETPKLFGLVLLAAVIAAIADFIGSWIYEYWEQREAMNA